MQVLKKDQESECLLTSQQQPEARKQWSRVLKILKENYLWPKILYPAKLSPKSKGRIRHFQICSLKNCTSQAPFLNNILAGCASLKWENRPRKRKILNTRRRRSIIREKKIDKWRPHDDSCIAGIKDNWCRCVWGLMICWRLINEDPNCLTFKNLQIEFSGELGLTFYLFSTVLTMCPATRLTKGTQFSSVSLGNFHLTGALFPFLTHLGLLLILA